MLTIFSVPKPFSADFASIQRNAIESWTRLDPRPNIVLIGDEDGVVETAGDLSVLHSGDIARNEFGTPLLNDVFSRAESLAVSDTMCFINADIILMSDFAAAVSSIRDWRRSFLMVGRRWNVEIKGALDFSDDWESRLLESVRSRGEASSAYWIDYFVFPRGLFGAMPPFAVGRPAYDNWLIWRARAMGATVVDASSAVMAVHQRHDYSHVSDVHTGFVPVSKGLHPLSQGGEAARNRELLGSWTHFQTIEHATRVMTSDLRLRIALGPRHLAARAGLPVRRLVEVSRPLRHKLGIRAGAVKRLWTRFSPKS